MKFLRNAGAERVIDLIRPWITPGNQLDVMTPSLSLFALAEMLGEISKLAKVRLLLPSNEIDLALLGTGADRGARNRLQTRSLAKRCARWLQDGVELRCAHGAIPQGAIVFRDPLSSG